MNKSVGGFFWGSTKIRYGGSSEAQFEELKKIWKTKLLSKSVSRQAKFQLQNSMLDRCTSNNGQTTVTATTVSEMFCRKNGNVAIMLQPSSVSKVDRNTVHTVKRVVSHSSWSVHQLFLKCSISSQTLIIYRPCNKKTNIFRCEHAINPSCLHY